MAGAQRLDVKRLVDELRTGFTGDPDGLRLHALATLRELGEAQGALWYQFGSIDGTVLPLRWTIHGAAALFGAMARWQKDAIAWQHASPMALPPSWLGRFRTTRTTIVDPERTYYPTPFYRRVIAPARISDQLRMFVSHRGALVAWIGCFRFDGEPDFQRAEVRRVAPLAAGLADALVGAHATERLGEPEAGADLVVTPTGRIEYASPGGRGLLRDQASEREVARWVREVDGGRSGAPTVCGMRVRWTRLYAPGRVRYLLQLEPATPVRLCASHVLSPMQRRVGELAGAGLTAAEIAAQLSIQESTVRAHLKATYRRLEVSSRAELAHALGSASSGKVSVEATSS